jgi:bifunctional non-homologous end joining protein LigD
MRGLSKESPSTSLSFVPPQLASPVDKPPGGSGWIHEVKLDGWRIQILVEGGTARVMTRRGLDWTLRFKQIARAAGELSCRAAILDGEAVVQDETGITRYDALIAGGKSPVFIAFDLMHLDREDLCDLPLTERRERLADLFFGVEPPLGFSDGFSGSGEDLFGAAEEMGLEGIVSKKADSLYKSGRSKTWLKAKAWDEDVLTLIGFELNSRGDPIPLLAREHAGLFTFAGAAQVGLPDEVGDRVAELQPVARAPVTGHGRQSATWLEPILKVKVRHRRGDAGNDLRHASVIGLAASRGTSK